MLRRRLTSLVAIVLLAACQGGDVPGNLPGSADDTQPYSEIGPEDVIRFAGTEPFWGGEVSGEQLLWQTADDPEDVTIAVERFAGRGGLSYTGTLRENAFAIAITPGECSDGMSDRLYPFVATVTIGDRLLRGCAWREGDDIGPPP